METSQKEHEMVSVWSDDRTVVISEDCPMIESVSETSWSNRAGKLVERIKQTEWVGELDLFSTPIKLTFNGEDCHKSEFGGLIYLIVVAISLFLTVIFQFPEGLTLGKPITYYSIVKDEGNTQTVFDHTDTFFQMYIVDAAGNKITDAAETAFFLKGVSLWQTINGVSTQLELSSSCEVGHYCFKKSTANSEATIYGTEANNKATLQLQIATCGLFSATLHPTSGQTCLSLFTSFAVVIQVTNFMEQTGELRPYTQKYVVRQLSAFKAAVTRRQYTTNNLFFGHLANLFSFDITSYYVKPENVVTTTTRNDASLDCFDMATFSGSNSCSELVFEATGNTQIFTQNFQDITAPLLFFLSVSQTLFYLLYLCFLRNYSNNCLYLRIADSLAYLPSESTHQNFKEGAGVFVACLIHKHKLLLLVDYVLYAWCKTQFKKYLPVKVQLTMDMIDYGQSCLSQKEFFQRINHIYQMQNLQPSKIVVDFDEEDREEEEVEAEEEEDEMDRVFDDEVKDEAFTRMCQDHQIYSCKRKQHLLKLLQQTEKNNKLVLMTQGVFGRYREQVRVEQSSKEIQVPINYVDEELSGHHLKRRQERREFKEEFS